MTTTAIVLFTRDLRVHDHPALWAACQAADRVVPLFVVDRGILGARYAAPNRVSQVVDAVHDLRSNLKARGGGLVVRHGDTIEEVAQLAQHKLQSCAPHRAASEVLGFGGVRDPDVEVASQLLNQAVIVRVPHA